MYDKQITIHRYIYVKKKPQVIRTNTSLIFIFVLSQLAGLRIKYKNEEGKTKGYGDLVQSDTIGCLCTSAD